MDRDGAVYYSSGIHFPFCNGIIENPEIPFSEHEIDNAIQFFESRKLPFMWWSPQKSLEGRGFKYGGSLTGVGLDISNLTLEPSAIEIKTVHEEADLKAFSTLFIEAFELDSKLLEPIQAVNRATLHSGEQVHFLAFVKGKPAGLATLSTSNASAGIWNLATKEEYQKKGVGSALVLATLAEAKKRGHNQVMGILMPDGQAWKLGAKLGFKEICKFPFYLYGSF